MDSTENGHQHEPYYPDPMELDSMASAPFQYSWSTASQLAPPGFDTFATRRGPIIHEGFIPDPEAEYEFYGGDGGPDYPDEDLEYGMGEDEEDVDEEDVMDEEGEYDEDAANDDFDPVDPAILPSKSKKLDPDFAAPEVEEE